MPKISVITPSIRPEYLNITQECLESQTTQDFEWLTELGLRNRGYLLSTDLNKMLRRAQGDIVVMLQDCIKVDSNFLEEVLTLHEKPNACFTYPVGKVKAWTEEPEFDWRGFGERREVEPQCWEADLASAPLQAFKDVGGYDEDYDFGWSWENVGIAYRMKSAGYTFEAVPSLKGVALDHDALTKNPFRGIRENNNKRATITKAFAEKGVYKLNYL